MGKRTFRAAVLFSLSILLLVFVTVSMTTIIVFCLFSLGWLNLENRYIVPLVPMAVSMIVGYALALFFGRGPLRMMERISDSMGRVAKGDFSVRLREDHRAEELRQISRSFNTMVQELAGTEMLRNDFVENVSHEFKTPLTAIEGYTTLLQKQGLSDEKRQEYTRRILQSTRRLNELTGNILLLSRLENQQLEVKKECYSLDEQLRECILLLENGWSDKEIELDIDLEDCEISANRELLSQVWENILGNAVKFSPKKGKISVSLHRTDDSWVIRMTDTGCGMTEEQQRHIFEKFYQGDRSRSTEGNGLGLALAKRIVDLHDGTITVESELHKGTEITVTLPFINTAV